MKKSNKKNNFINNIYINEAKFKEIKKNGTNIILGTTIFLLSATGIVALKNPLENWLIKSLGLRPIHKTPITDVLSEEKKNTCFDEIIEKKGINLDDVNKLDEYLKISNRLSGFVFKGSKIENEEQLNNYKLMDPSELNDLITDYVDKCLKDKIEAANEIEEQLIIQENLVNYYICNNGYDIMSNVLEASIITEIADSYYLDENSYQKIMIDPKQEGNITNSKNITYIPLYIDNVKIRVATDELLYDAIENLSILKENASREPKFMQAVRYNEARNYYITKALITCKKLLKTDTTIEKGYTKTKTKENQ